MTYEELGRKALKYGYTDPGSYLADNCSLWSIPLYFCIALTIAGQLFGIVGIVIFFLGLFFWAARLNAFNMGEQGLLLILLISMTIGPFSTPFIILKRIGIRP